MRMQRNSNRLCKSQTKAARWLWGLAKSQGYFGKAKATHDWDHRQKDPIYVRGGLITRREYKLDEEMRMRLGMRWSGVKCGGTG